MRGRIAYQPALDGVRALAVGAVLLFHADVAGFQGGYLGVSVFFTLSGFLITRLLLAEHEATGRIDVPAFYARRVRRLLPVSLLTVASIVALATTTTVFDGVVGLRADVLGALLQAGNWVQLAGEGSYAELLADTSGRPSPLAHFWSLGVEEQFYWIWPLAMAGLLRRRGGSIDRPIAALTAISAALAVVIAAVWGADAAYWATPARLAEILAGALLAVILRSRSLHRYWHALAPLALAVLTLCVVSFPAHGGPAYAGALPLVSVCSAMLLLGLQVDGPVTRWLSVAPLVWLGTISYGVYLIHWPVYVVLDADRVGVDGLPLTLVRVAVTLALAAVSYRFVEAPIRAFAGVRRGAAGVRRDPTVLVGGVLTATMVWVSAAAVPSFGAQYWLVDDQVAAAAAIVVDERPLRSIRSGQPGDDGAAAPRPGSIDRSVEPGIQLGAPVPDRLDVVVKSGASTPERPVRILVTGDSTAGALGAGIVAWAAEHPELAQAEIGYAAGCGFVRGGEVPRGDGFRSDSCEGWVESTLFAAVERTRPDLVVAMVTTWDVLSRRWDGGEVLSPADPEFALRIEEAYRLLIDQMAYLGVPKVILVRQPIPDIWWLPELGEEEQADRHAVVFATYARLAIERPDRVEVIAFDRWFSEHGLDTDRDVRPDGVHLDPGEAARIVERFLGPALLEAAVG